MTGTLINVGAVLLGGLIGEAIGIEARLARLGDRLQRRVARASDPARGARDESTVSEAFFAASLLFCVGPLTVVGSFEDGLNGNVEPLATKSLLDGFASEAARPQDVKVGNFLPALVLAPALVGLVSLL